MDHDDQPIGQILSRREVLKWMGTASAALLVGCAVDTSEPPAAAPGQAVASNTPAQASVNPTQAAAPASATTAAAALPTCIVRPAMTEGPYFVDERLNRSDIRSDPSDASVKEGVPLRLAFRVSRIDGAACAALAGAAVDIWHCDALGVYSDVQDPGFDTSGQLFLRGYQLTDANGVAEFLTIYPGWYQGRTVHIHFKIRTDLDSAQGYEFTSQLFFDDQFSDQVYTQEPYASKGQRNIRNQDDGIYRNGGDQLILAVAGGGEGLAATFDIGLQMA